MQVMWSETHLQVYLTNLYEKLLSKQDCNMAKPQDQSKRASLAKSKQSRSSENLYQALNAEGEYGLIVIEEISYYLADMRQGFNHCQLMTRTLGTLLSKMSSMFNIPIIVTSIIAGDMDEHKYSISPWYNFVNDSIFIDKMTISEHYKENTGGEYHKPITRMLYQSKIAPFCTIRSESGSTEHTYTFKFKISSLQESESTAPTRYSHSEKTI